MQGNDHGMKNPHFYRTNESALPGEKAALRNRGCFTNAYSSFSCRFM
jgi:hypothetical protein